MNDLEIRLITTKDIVYTQVWTLREEVLRQPIGLSLKDEDLSGEANEWIFIAEDRSKVVGCLMLHPLSTKEMKFRQMAVEAAWQGKNIGRMLVETAEKYTWENGFDRIVLHARMVAAGFYEKLKYSAIGDQFMEVGMPHVLMQKLRP